MLDVNGIIMECLLPILEAFARLEKEELYFSQIHLMIVIYMAAKLKVLNFQDNLNQLMIYKQKNFHKFGSF